MEMTTSSTFVSLRLADISGVGEVRRAAYAKAVDCALDETDRGRAALVATELASNIVRHAGEGEVLLGSPSPGHGLSVLALDRGPGIADVAKSLRDGYSTAGSMGTGLGAVCRLADDFEIVSHAGAGTAVLARICPKRVRAPSTGLDIGAFSVARSGEEHCGDGWAAEYLPRGTAVLVVDGLGHGDQASEAAAQAIRIFRESPSLDVAQALDSIHRALRGTRGAAASVAAVPDNGGNVRYAGIGNISGAIVAAGGIRMLVSHHGTLGHNLQKIHVFEYPWPEEAMLILHSDGLVTHWDLDAYPGAASRDPLLVAGLLYRDHARGRDDVTVLVGKRSRK